MGTANPVPFDYSHRVNDRKRSDMREKALSILKRLSKEELATIARDGFENWLRFGLMLKKRFKERDTVFATAVERTSSEIKEIERGNIPVDPEKLLFRYLMKLMVGLEAANKYAEAADIPDSRTRVFDTPEYLPAAGLLTRYANVPSERFAIPSVAPEANEQTILELLKIDQAISPLCQPDFQLLLDAVEHVRSVLDALGEREATAKLASECEIAKRELKAKGWRDFAKGSLAVPTVIAALFEGPTTATMVPLVALLTVVLYSLEADKQLRDCLNNSSAAARFISAKEMFYGWNPIHRMRETCVSAFLRLARSVVPRPATEERIARQMMEPWLQTPSWYD